ncbi:conserved hypothetical protein [Parafrankia sp. EAN1pec]|uniref:hypothetical protein n=1 Tax=Parafrankia sp. (strain EAN1pec) TaxID=298653 RepID=UPI000054391A|nr:conserved hypothetical protein [Frankia sp. EAN1pec]
MIVLARTRLSPRGGLLSLTEHPLQRAGAWAIAVLAGRERPSEVTAADLDEVAGRITADVVRAAVAGKDYTAYDWWKVLFAMFPNSEPTHAGRPRDREALIGTVARFFLPDLEGESARPCCFCGAAASVLWSKKMLPLFDSTKAVNTLPPATAGWPVCRGCRIAWWAMPYGANVTAGSATVLSCDEEAVERAFAAAGCVRTARVRSVGFSSLSADASPEAVTLWVLRDHASSSRPVAATLWSFKNDNQEPWLRVSETRIAVVGFLRALPADPEAHRGWRTLQRQCNRVDRKGTVVRLGRDVVARALFDSVNFPPDQLCRELSHQVDDLGRVSASTIRAWRALYALYLKEMYGMDRKALEPVTTLLVDWIGAEKNPRGRFNEYRKVAGRGFDLQVLLMGACARLYLDGQKPPDVTRITEHLLASGQEGHRLRGQLFFEVVAELVGRGVEIGARTTGAATEAGTETEADGPLVGVDADEDEEAYV